MHRCSGRSSRRHRNFCFTVNTLGVLVAVWVVVVNVVVVGFGVVVIILDLVVVICDVVVVIIDAGVDATV